MPFWYRTMCEELFCIPILIYQDEDGKNKNNLFNIGKYREILVFQKGYGNQTHRMFTWSLLKIQDKGVFMFQ